MLGLTVLGVIHTAISLVAVAAGIAAFVRRGAIRARNRVGQVYVVATLLTCLTGFGIFQRGGFGIPHVLGIVTLAVLGVALLAAYTRVFGGLSRYVETLALTTTFFFHMIPGFTETGTRLPSGSPLFTGPEDPVLQKVIGVVFMLYLAGTVWQVLRLRRAPVDLDADEEARAAS